MTGVSYNLELQNYDQVMARLEGLGAWEKEDLAFDLGAVLESSTKERIATEKAGPNGEDWVAWSEAYDETRNHGVHSLLVGEGNLLDSIQNYSSGTTVRVGSNLVYAAIHHFGGDEVDIPIPARPYLGLSAEDEEEIRALVLGDFKAVLQ